MTSSKFKGILRQKVNFASNHIFWAGIGWDITEHEFEFWGFGEYGNFGDFGDSG